MIPISYIEILNAIIEVSKLERFIIDYSKFNQIVSLCSHQNFYCRFSYSDIETYARTIPTIASISDCYITFKPTEQWAKLLRHYSNFYDVGGLDKIINEILIAETE